MHEETYQKLREFMDTLPAGYPATPTGVEIKILKKLYTPEQAKLTMKLGRNPEEVSVIAKRIQMTELELAPKLEEMAQNGLIFRVRQGDKILYQAYQFVVGVYEFQLKNLDREFCELFEEYFPYFGMSLAKVKTTQLRVIPTESAVEGVSTVAPYNRARDLVRKHDIIAVAQCICKKEQELLGRKCERPQETCIFFDDFAQFYIDNGMARWITTTEALMKLDLAEKSALVFCPTNDQKLKAICCCCTCCCPTLRFAKTLRKPAKFMKSDYEAQINPDLCTKCEVCIERCQMDAIKQGDPAMEIIEGRCIGCGLCVASCPTEAISMVERSGVQPPPEDIQATLKRIMSERGITTPAA
jgi:electron transport complex protein RnfB